jgi:hypothetical protein
MSVPALDAIFAEWTRTDLGFRQRLSDLEGSSGSGATPLNRVNGQAILLTASTVHADGSPDILTGTNHTDPTTKSRAHNWYFFDGNDVIVNFLVFSDQRTRVK